MYFLTVRVVPRVHGTIFLTKFLGQHWAAAAAFRSRTRSFVTFSYLFTLEGLEPPLICLYRFVLSKKTYALPI